MTLSNLGGPIFLGWQSGSGLRYQLECPYRMIPLPGRFTKELTAATSDFMRGVGIYYWIDEADGRHGKAMIIGPEDTPYAFCPLVFEVQCPTDYPFSPPKVEFKTSDGVTRFHPNLYVAGKVCLSILGTWPGPKWSAALSLSTVLTSIQSLLEGNPIVNEPGWEKFTLENPRAKAYAGAVQFRLIALSLKHLKEWKAGNTPAIWKEFEDVLEERGDELYQKLLGIVRIRAEQDEQLFENVPYTITGITGWKDLAVEKLEEENRH
jgi:ubiquitin-protein ligase